MSPSSAHDPVKAHLSYWKRVAPVDKLHVASPFFLSEPDDENEFITPAVEGTKRVVNAAMGAGVKRLVLTSSVADMELGVINPAAVLGPIARYELY